MSNKMSANKKNIFQPSLADVETGCRCRVTALSGIAAERLSELGLTVGVTVAVLRTAPLGDPLEIALRGYRLCLRKETAKRIFVTDISHVENPLDVKSSTV